MGSAVVNILIIREVRPEAREEFERAIREWMPIAAGYPGHLGAFSLDPASDSSEHGVLIRLRDEASWRAFQGWGRYHAFLDALRPLLSAEPRTQELHGLEAWFLPTDGAAPPRWKMAALTYVGVVATVWLASRGVELLWRDGPAWASFLTVNAVVVAALTWIVMPGLTRVMGRWLAKERADA